MAGGLRAALLGTVVALALIALGALLPVVIHPAPGPPPSPAEDAISPTDPFWVARTLARLGLSKDAIDAASATRSSDPQATLPPEILKLGADPADPFDKARALAAAGFDADAKASLKKVVDERPSRSVPPELRYLSDRPIREWSTADLSGAVVAVLMNTATVVVATAAIAAFVVLLVSIVRRLFETRIQVREFDGEADQKLGKAVAIAVEDELLQLRREGGSSSFIFMRGAESDLKIPDPVKEIAPAVKLIGALVEMVPSQIHTLTGTLQPRSERGVGLTVGIADPRGGIRASATLWEKDFDPSYVAPTGDDAAKLQAARMAYLRLSLAAASWAIYQHPLDPGERLRSGYLTEHWSSYAAHRVAASLQDDGHDDRARRGYVSALERDPANTGSLFNLGQLDGDRALGQGSFAKKERALLERALARAREARGVITVRNRARSDRSVERDRIVYRMHYGIGRLALHYTLRDQDLVKETRIALLTEAESEAAALLVRARKYLQHPDAGSELERFVTRIEAATVVLLCGAWTELLKLDLHDVPKDLELPKELAPEGKRQPANVILKRFPAVGRMRLDRMTRYNLACYFSGINTQESLEEALGELAFGLAAHRVKAAREDPSLGNLQIEPWLTRFNALLGQFAAGDSVVVTDLSRVQRIGPFAVKLAERQIKTADQLEPYARDQVLRAQLARELGASEGHIKAWSEILGLRKLRGLSIGLPEAELLFEVGLRSPSDLSGRDARVLTRDLKSLNTVKKLMEVPPEESVVESWIRAET